MCVAGIQIYRKICEAHKLIYFLEWVWLNLFWLWHCVSHWYIHIHPSVRYILVVALCVTLIHSYPSIRQVYYFVYGTVCHTDTIKPICQSSILFFGMTLCVTLLHSYTSFSQVYFGYGTVCHTNTFIPIIQSGIFWLWHCASQWYIHTHPSDKYIILVIALCVTLIQSYLSVSQVYCTNSAITKIIYLTDGWVWMYHCDAQCHNQNIPDWMMGMNVSVWHTVP